MELLDTLAKYPMLFIGCCTVLGLLIGSFLNVVIYRLPVMMDNELRDECAELAEATAPPPLPDVRVEASAEPPVDAEAAAPETLTERPARQPFNLVVPRSACPQCRAPITALQNVPVISWIALGGRCANCRAPISARYPAVELLTGIASGLVAWRLGFGLTALAGLFFTWTLI